FATLFTTRSALTVIHTLSLHDALPICLSDDVIEDLIANFEGPLVIDADGLYHLNRHEVMIRKRTAPLIITPHTGEMARILGKDRSEEHTSELQSRFDIVCRLLLENKI